MIALLQRVSQASVQVQGEVIGQIGAGLLVLLCAEKGDTEAVAEKLLAKMLKLRIFSDDAGKMNLSVQNVDGGLLVVSQFTLAADVGSGTRPGFRGQQLPRRRAAFTTILWRRPARCIHRYKPGVLPPTCRWPWSTTDRSRFRCA